MINFSLHPKDSPVSILHGLGKRIPLWVQGCSIRCTDQCISWQGLERKRRIVLSADSVLAVLKKRLSEFPDIEGITFLGGEPTDQAKYLSVIAKKIRQWGFSVMTYSGHTWEYLMTGKNRFVKELLSETDLLKAGPYIPMKSNDKLLWRGSENQTLHVLSERYDYERLRNTPLIKGADISLTVGGRLVISGCSDYNLIVGIEKNLRKKALFNYE